MCVEFTSILQDFPRIYNEFTDEYIGLLWFICSSM